MVAVSLKNSMEVVKEKVLEVSVASAKLTEGLTNIEKKITAQNGPMEDIKGKVTMAITCAIMLA